MLRLAVPLGVVSGLLLITASPSGPEAQRRREAFVSATGERWRAQYGTDPDLQVARIEVSYHQEAHLFVEGEGLVVAPVGVELPDSQEILDIVADPPALRELKVEGITNLAWEYAGRLNRDLSYLALVLTRRGRRAVPALPDGPTHQALSTDLRFDALATATELREHRLEKCAAFSAWAAEVAGEPPHTDQLRRIVRTLGGWLEKSESRGRPENPCAGIREQKLSPHQAHVVAVMSAREVGIPAFGFTAASARHAHLVGTYVDGVGWVLLDLEQPEDGYFTGGPVLLTKVPLLGPFEASDHSFWGPEAGAYLGAPWGGVADLSGTVWLGETVPDELTHTTRGESLPLGELR